VYVIIVEFDLLPGRAPDFLPLITRNARQSLQLEAGCEAFDVLLSAHAPEHIVLYECYRDRESFDAHCRSAHFLAFDAATREFVSRKSFAEFERAALPELA
jgi:quinol monooxygenase YgiN